MNKIIISLCALCLVLSSCNRRHELEYFFKKNDSLVLCNKSLTEKNNDIYIKFDKQKIIDSAKVKPYWEKAQTAKKFATELTGYIETVKAEVISRESGIPAEEAKTIDMQKLHKLRKFEESTRYLIGTAPDGSTGEAHNLKTKIEKYKGIMIQLLDSADRAGIEKEFGLNVEDPYYDADHNKQTWEHYNFYQTILAANVVILNTLISEVKNAEGKVIAQLFAESGIKK